MRRLTLATIAVLLLSGSAAADFKAGLEAYQRGDYATALHEWQPLAEKGDANSQYNLGLLYNLVPAFRRITPKRRNGTARLRIRVTLMQSITWV